MANKFPLVFDSTGKSLQELPTGDNLDLTGSSILNAIDITATGTLTVNTVSAQNISIDGGIIAEVAKTNDYNDLSNKPTLFSGDYNDLTNKPTSIGADWADVTNKPFIPSRTSQLTNDANFVSNNQISILPIQVTGLSNIATSGSFNDLSDVPDYISREEVAGGTLTVELKNTGDLIGSVFGADSSIIVDHLANELNVATVNTDIINANILNAPDFNLVATDDLNIKTDTYLTIRSTSFRLLNTLTGTELYDVDKLVIRGDVDFQFASVTGLSLNQVVGDLTGSVFADDSSVIIDGIGKSININTLDANIISTTELNCNNFNSSSKITLNGTNGIDVLTGGPVNIPNATTVSIAGTQGITIEASNDLVLTSSSGKIDFTNNSLIDFSGAAVTGLAALTGDVNGSVFGDDSTLLVDAVNNTIPASVISGTFAQVNTPELISSTTLTLDSANINLRSSGIMSIQDIGTGGINIGSGSNTVSFVNGTSLNISDLTDINFSNSVITGLTGGSIGYTASVPANWNGAAPTTTQEAIDRIAAWIEAQGGALA